MIQMYQDIEDRKSNIIIHKGDTGDFGRTKKTYNTV
jgi:hypothetical protein